MSKKHHKHNSHSHKNHTATHQNEVEMDAAVKAELNNVESISASSSDEINTEAQNEGIAHPESPANKDHDAGTFNAGSADDELAPEEMTYEGGSPEPEEKTHVEFYGSEIIRQKAPKVMEVADQVVEEWKKDGNFESIKVGHPLASMAAGRALRKAKEVEKKLEEKGVFAMAKMGVDYVKHEIDKRRKHE
ncbi:hypothetical protein B9G69_002115 [Bdellovibrio sp. SKB1291214]|uniref:hypothetical protein n=1 Tax=Bdellovibrio sp. SKB1291214 TaxID=1732569 RepID=UPI000B51E32B|nr:hypothetical protein [Bdellovibrio sp. SKB1291214]UYL09366.1 hypothetical protein B9G69_002115 [Bdellovibrio sp. SKB1291214]